MSSSAGACGMAVLLPDVVANGRWVGAAGARGNPGGTRMAGHSRGDGIRLAGAVAVVIVVAAEMIGAKAGLGYLINASQYNFAIPQMYAGIVTISVLGVGFNQLLVVLERRFTSWRIPVEA